MSEKIKAKNSGAKNTARRKTYERRAVTLTPKWYKTAFLPFILHRETDGAEVFAAPNAFGGYSYVDPETKKRYRVTAKTDGQFRRDAISLYPPFPARKLTLRDLFFYRFGSVQPTDYVWLIFITLLATGLSMLFPMLTKTLTGGVLSSGRTELLLGIGVFLLMAELSSQMLGVVKSLTASRIQTKTKLSVEAATMLRVLSLPIRFFRNYTTGEVKERMASVGQLCDVFLGGTIFGGISAVSSLMFVSQIFHYAPALTVPALILILCTVLLSAAATLTRTKISGKQMEAAAKESGFGYALIRGAVKIKETGAERQAYKKWEELYRDKAKYDYDPPMIVKLNPVFMTGLKLVGTVVLYFLAAKSGVSVSDYLAFSTAYGGLMGAFSSLTDTGLSFAGIPPLYAMARPILDAVPISNDGEDVDDLTGAISLSHITFRYDKDSPAVLDDVSLDIKAGEYVAIVGKTGCGKTTLVRLLTGLETPESGEIYFDGKPMSELNIKSLRKQIGVVLQDGRLFADDIYTNIAIGAPDLSLDEIWQAAEMAGIADDIRKMPLGLFTPLSEGTDGVSGGQRQRLLIARAIAKKPRILILDEATSALDSELEQKISEAVGRMRCTRIVVAHRESTVKNSDRVFCVEGGAVREKSLA